MKRKIIHYALVFLLGFISGISLFLKCYQLPFETKVVYLPKIIKEKQEPKIVEKEKIVKVLEKPLLQRNWLKFSFEDEYVKISYWAYDSSADLSYEINSEKFVKFITKTEFKEKPVKQNSLSLGLSFYNLKIKPSIYFKHNRLGCGIIIDRTPSFLLTYELLRF
ncbi:MAG: hypothetical protein ABIM98_07385 [candidate division WOR-3 bacterium]